MAAGVMKAMYSFMFLDGEAYDRFNMTEEEEKLADKAEKDKKR